MTQDESTKSLMPLVEKLRYWASINMRPTLTEHVLGREITLEYKSHVPGVSAEYDVLEPNPMSRGKQIGTLTFIHQDAPESVMLLTKIGSLPCCDKVHEYSVLHMDMDAMLYKSFEAELRKTAAKKLGLDRLEMDEAQQRSWDAQVRNAFDKRLAAQKEKDAAR